MNIIIKTYNDFLIRAFDYKGRSTRTEFWIPEIINFFIKFTILPLILIYIANTTAFANPKTDFASLLAMSGLGLVVLVLFIPSISLTIRRLRDAGFSPWYYLLTLTMFIPLIGIISTIALFVMLCFPSRDK